ncbi:ATP-binding protein [Brevundimonas sp.]|uniref:sensor histidine kinase n=1 Tax=Brevundimonas sp. TaxID=1871086 RepID=UPI0035B18331
MSSAQLVSMPFSRVLDRSPLPPEGAQAVAARVLPNAQGALAVSPLAPILTSVAMAVLVMLSIRFGRTAEGIVVMWLPVALAVAAWIRTGRGLSHDLLFGGVLSLGILIGELLSGHHLVPAFWLTGANMAEIVLAVALGRRLAPDFSVSSVTAILRLFAVVALATLVGAAIGSAYFTLATGASYWLGVQTWWFGHTLGMVIALPLLLSVGRQSLVALSKPVRLLEWAGLMAMIAGACWWIYFSASIPMGFLLNALMVLVAARLRVAGVSLAMLIASGFVFAAMLGGAATGAVGSLPIDERLIATQLMLVSVALPFLMVAALLQERDGYAERAVAGQAKAERASAAKSRLLANVAHEIKSPVAGVIGIGELWSSGQLGTVTPQQAEMADMLVRTARQVETLAHDLLDVAQAEAGRVPLELRPVDVAGVVDDVRRKIALMPEASKLLVDVVLEGDGLVARADSIRLTQVIGNLATNAVKYGGVGGEVRFRVRRLGEVVRVDVTDQGPGLTPEKQAQLFEPFNRLGLERSTIEGHGIGLTLAKRLTELMGGTIGVKSAPGEGATFWIELPAVG